MNLNCPSDYKRYIFYFFSFTHRCFIFILLFFVGYYRLSNYFLCNWKVISKVIPVMKKMIRSMIQYNMYNSMKKIIELNSSLWNKFIVDVSTFHGQFILNNKCQFQIVHKVFFFLFYLRDANWATRRITQESLQTDGMGNGWKEAAIHYQNVIVDGCRRPLRVSDSGTSVRGTSLLARVSRQTYLSLSVNSTRSNDFHGGPESWMPRVARVLLTLLIYNLISSSSIELEEKFP